MRGCGENAAAPITRRRWAMLIQHVYQADPLLCPHCGGTMKIISFMEARQSEIIRKILTHCGLWQEPPPRAPPHPPNLFDIQKREPQRSTEIPG
jgi:hypothetical protein